MQQTIDLLDSLDFGSSVAEEETKNLQKYFVNTRFWRNLSNDKYDIVLGAKGSGKSALYLNLISRRDEFAERNIVIVEAENPLGDTVFALLNNATRTEKYDNPNKEALIQGDIIDFWKLYFLTVIVSKLRATGFKGDHFKVIESLLESAGLLPKTFSLTDAFNNVLHFLRQVVSLQFFQPEVEVNPNTGTFTLKGKITFEKFSAKEHKEGYNTLDELLEKLNTDLSKADQTVWILLDRLDVAFINEKDLERRALKALFMVYNSLKRYEQLRFKIFLRDDIMMKITYDGLREASHLTRMINLVIDENTLFNILVKRLLNNPVITRLYNINVEECLLDIEKQKHLFKSVFPEKVEENGEAQDTFDWIVSRISDGNGMFTPRELIHFLNQSKEQQIELLELGNKTPEGKLFTQDALKRAIREVSKAKYERTLIAENPDLIDNFKKFKSASPNVSAEWMKAMLRDKEGKKIEDMDLFANALSDIGFLKRVSETDWAIPYLYQYALGIAAEE
ncbi:MAG: P-loop ATPase, Sll1717 family [Saprospiraceae bacterium]